MNTEKFCSRPLFSAIFLFIFFNVLAILAFGQHYLVHTYTETNGLPNVPVSSITQDSKGRIWLASANGLLVFDGMEWKPFNEPDGTAAAPFTHITCDSAGTILTLSKPDKNRFFTRCYSELPENTTQVITLKTPFVHSSTRATAFDVFPLTSQPTGRDAILLGTNNTGLWIHIFDGWKQLTPKDGLPSYCINEIACTSESIAVATTGGLSIIRIDRKGNVTIDNRINRLIPREWKEIKAIASEYPGKFPGRSSIQPRLWLYTSHGIAVIENNQFYPRVHSHELHLIDKNARVHLLPDYRNGLYIGTSNELIYLNTHTFLTERITAANGLTDNGVNSLFIDFEKNIWATGQQGISKIVSRRFKNFRTSHGLLNDEILAISEIGRYAYAIGHPNGLTIIDRTGFTRIPFCYEPPAAFLPELVTGNSHPNGTPSGNSGNKSHSNLQNRISRELTANGLIPSQCRLIDMKTDLKKNTWIALSQGEIIKIDRSFHITRYTFPANSTRAVTCLWIDRENRVMIGTDDGLFALTQKPSPRIEPVSIPGSSHLSITCIESFPCIGSSPIPAETNRKIPGKTNIPGEILCIGTKDSGLFVFQNNTWMYFGTSRTQKSHAIYSIYYESNRRILAGTSGGLYAQEIDPTPASQNKSSGILKRFYSAGFHADVPIYFILRDRNRGYWFGTEGGVIRWDGQKSKRLTTADGLSGMKMKRSGALVDSEGHILIGTNDGISIADDSISDIGDVEQFTPVPRVNLISLESSTKLCSLKTSAKILLGYRDNAPEFHFNGISFIDEASIRFQWKLEGYDPEWSEETYPYRQTIRYTNLLPGTYRFHLRARNALGYWSEVVSSPMIIVLKPFYQTRWFYIGIFIIFLSIFAIVSKTFNMKRQSILLEKQVKERTHQLQTMEQRYRTLFETSKDMIYMTNPNGEFIDINPSGIELLHYNSKEEFLETGSAHFLCFNPEDREKLRDTIEKNGYVKDYELEFKRKNGENISILLTATLIRDKDGRSVAYYGIGRDMTKQKLLEQKLIQSQKMEAIGTLAGGIAHDFNNILGVIVGYTELAFEDAPQGSIIRSNIEQILIASNRASDLVKQILAFSRQTDSERRRLTITPLLKEALKLLRTTLPPNIEIRQELRASSDVIMADATQIHQVIMNLCTNAGHAMKENGGILSVTLDEVYLDPESHDGNKDIKLGYYIRLAVSDTGHGIPEIVLKRIFEPYFTTKKQGEGTGMGLAVIHGIVKNHGGDISVYSEPGKGSTFHVFFPKVQGEAESQVHPQEEIPGGSETILLVDDEEALTEVKSKTLKRLGYRVVKCTNPIDALELFRKEKNRFDLIFSDISMPRMNGLQLAEEIKRISPRTPIILSSGFSTAMLTEQMKAIGIESFVMKPIIKRELAHVVRKILDEKKQKSLFL